MAFDLSALSAISSLLDNDIKTRAVLKINGKEFNSWKEINVSRSIAQIAGSFSFTTSNRFSGENEKWGLTTGDKCTIDIAGQRVLTGYLDDLEDSYSLNRRNAFLKEIEYLFESKKLRYNLSIILVSLITSFIIPILEFLSILLM